MLICVVDMIKNAKEAVNLCAHYGYDKDANNFRDLVKLLNKMAFDINTATSTKILDDIENKLEYEYEQFTPRYNEILDEI